MRLNVEGFSRVLCGLRAESVDTFHFEEFGGNFGQEKLFLAE